MREWVNYLFKIGLHGVRGADWVIARSEAKTPEPKKRKSSFRTKKPNLIKSPISQVEKVLSLQRTVGNRAVENLLKSGFIQAKLAFRKPLDQYSGAIGGRLGSPISQSLSIG